MSTVVKVDEDAKSKLEELRAEVKLKTGKKVTQQEILTQLIESAVDSKTEFVDSFRDGTWSLSEREIEAFNQGQFASGVETDEEDIDEILYGRRSRTRD